MSFGAPDLADERLRLETSQPPVSRHWLVVILAISLIVASMLLSGCHWPAQTTPGPVSGPVSRPTSGSTTATSPATASTSENPSASGSTSVSDNPSASAGTSSGLPTILIQDITAGSIDRRLAIEGDVFNIERHSGGNIKLTCADDSGEITVFIPADVAVDDLNLTTEETYRIIGRLQPYRDQLELVPGQPDDVIKVTSGFGFPAVQVTSVVDGDTVHVRYADGHKEKVRIIGIDSPELARDGQPAEAYADQAREYMMSLLLDKTVYLEQDNSDTDRYGRQLRYVWLEKPDRITVEAIHANLVSSILLSQGYAVFVEIGLDNKYEMVLRDDENQARADRLGLWLD